MKDQKALIGKPLFWAAVTLVIAAAAVWIFLAAVSAASIPAAPEELYGNYRFEKQVYMNGLSSFLAFDGYEEYYTLKKDKLTITGASGEGHSYNIGYKFSEVSEKDFKALFMAPEEFSAPDISKYKQRYQYVLCESSDYSPGFTLYLMDNDIWLTRMSSGRDGVKYIWSIYKIQKYAGALPTAEAKPETVSPVPLSDITLDLYLGGEHVYGFSIEDEKQKSIIEEAIIDGMSKSTAWPPADTDSLKDYIVIRAIYSDTKEEAEFFVFDKDRRHFLQLVGNWRSCEITNEPYTSLKELAARYGKPEAMKVSSGDDSVDAFGYVYCTQPAVRNYVPDFNKLTLQQAAGNIEYLPVQIGPDAVPSFSLETGGGAADGEEDYYINLIKVYNISYIPVQVDTIMPYDPALSESNSYKKIELFDESACPGKYVVELEVHSSTGETAMFAQYFFGVILTGGQGN